MLPSIATLALMTIFPTDLSAIRHTKDVVKGDIEYSRTNFIVRSTLGHWYPLDDSRGAFHLHYSVNVLGWIEDPFSKSKLKYNEVFRNNNVQLMNLCYQLGKYWLHSYIQLPHAQSYNKTASPQFLESDFMNFSQKELQADTFPTAVNLESFRISQVWNSEVFRRRSYKPTPFRQP